ncbi:MAG: amidase [Pseudomonadota bacterium]
MTDAADLNVHDAVVALQAGDVSALELVDACLSRIESEGGQSINAFIHVAAEQARDAAKDSDKRRVSGQHRSHLDGVPIAIKDNIDVQGQPTTNGQAQAWYPHQDAPVITRLREAGMVILGKLNMHEGALGATTDNPHHGRCEHPFYPGFTPGGSSGGSAAVVAGGLCPAALGTDTMGSVRLPAAYCGIVGLKPTRGFWPIDGVAPLARGLDTVGPMAKTVQDVAMLVDVDVGDHDLTGQRVGVLVYDNIEVEPECERALARALDLLSGKGVQFDTVAFSNFDTGSARRAGFVVCQVDAAQSLEEFRKAQPQAYSPEFQAMLDYGKGVSPERYQTAREIIATAGQEFLNLLSGYDVLLSLTAPQRTFPFSDETPRSQADLTAIANFSGCPAITLPLPVEDGGRPVGLQLMSGLDTDRLLIQVASQIERMLAEN